VDEEEDGRVCFLRGRFWGLRMGGCELWKWNVVKGEVERWEECCY
jgi:hypothetical protein